MRVNRHLLCFFSQSKKLFLTTTHIKFFALILIALNIYNTAQAQGFKPSPAQIEQFKQLPPSEQKRLAQSLGVNLNDFSGLLGGSAQSTTPKSEAISGKRVRQNKRATNQLESIASKSLDSPTLKEDKSPTRAKNTKLKLFGYDIFNLGADSFAPTTAIPAPANYLLGTGDTLIVQLYGKENQTVPLNINKEGAVQFPNVGPVNIAGLTFSQAKEKINTIVSEQMIGVKASTTMGELRSTRIFVLGEAAVPGSYVVSSLSTMTNALFASGGVTEIGSLRNIQLKRAGKVVTTLDLYDLLLRGDTSKDARIQPGDVIFIPPIGKTVGVSGEVKRPAIYELKNENTVQDVINLTGGLLPTAFVPASRIERITEAGEKTLVNIDISTRSGKNYSVKDADVIQVFSTLETMRDIVQLEGHVKRPGGFAWKQGLRFTDIIPSVDDMLSNPDIEVGLILREQKETRKINVKLFSPIKAFSEPNSANNPLLQSRDQVVLFDYNSNRPDILKDVLQRLKTQSSFEQREQTAIVYGSVRFPGEYPISDDMTSKDLVQLSGGLTESALGNNGEITRISLNKNREAVATHLNVNLNESSLIIKAGDTLRVKQVPLWNKKEAITISGEVLHPGTYPIIPGETLIDVLSRAGGLTRHAYPQGAIFSREELRQLEAERLDALKVQVETELANNSINESVIKKSISAEQTQQILDSISATRPLGRMVIDLPMIMNTPEQYDFKVENGDSLSIPRFKPSVTVVGEVQYATSHFYNRKLSVSDYINRSGGTRKRADKKRIYIVKANGQVILPKSSSWFKNKQLNITPGDTIVVPIEANKIDKITLWSSITTIMSNAAIGIAALNNLK